MNDRRKLRILKIGLAILLVVEITSAILGKIEVDRNGQWEIFLAVVLLSTFLAIILVIMGFRIADRLEEESK